LIDLGETVGLLEIAKKIFSKDEFDEFNLSLKMMDGCEGEEAVAKLIKKIKERLPC